MTSPWLMPPRRPGRVTPTTIGDDLIRRSGRSAIDMITERVRSHPSPPALDDA